jgi:hypothetical protein
LIWHEHQRNDNDFDSKVVGSAPASPEKGFDFVQLSDGSGDAFLQGAAGTKRDRRGSQSTYPSFFQTG